MTTLIGNLKHFKQNYYLINLNIYQPHIFVLPGGEGVGEIMYASSLVRGSC